MSILRSPIVKKAATALAVKELVDRVQAARAPRKSFLRRNFGKIALLALAGAGAYVFQQQRASSSPSFGDAGRYTPPREPSIEPDERLDSSLKAPAESDKTPTPAG